MGTSFRPRELPKSDNFFPFLAITHVNRETCLSNDELPTFRPSEVKKSTCYVLPKYLIFSYKEITIAVNNHGKTV